jgi:hypothetical protein
MLGSSRTNGWYFVYQSGVLLWYTKPAYIKRLTILIYLLVKVGKLCLLKSATQFYSGLDGASFLHKSVAHAFEIEGGVIFVQCIAHPEVYLSATFLETDASVQCAVE